MVQSFNSATSAPIAASTGASAAPTTAAVSGNSATVRPSCWMTTRRILPSRIRLRILSATDSLPALNDSHRVFSAIFTSALERSTMLRRPLIASDREGLSKGDQLRWRTLIVVRVVEDHIVGGLRSVGVVDHGNSREWLPESRAVLPRGIDPPARPIFERNAQPLAGHLLDVVAAAKRRVG